MLKISCRDIGGGCDFVASGETADGAKGALMEHARRDHADMLGSLTPEQMQAAQQRMDEYLASPAARA